MDRVYDLFSSRYAVHATKALCPSRKEVEAVHYGGPTQRLCSHSCPEVRDDSGSEDRGASRASIVLPANVYGMKETAPSHEWKVAEVMKNCACLETSKPAI